MHMDRHTLFLHSLPWRGERLVSPRSQGFALYCFFICQMKCSEFGKLLILVMSYNSMATKYFISVYAIIIAHYLRSRWGKCPR